jgi:hypothetical protein
MIQVGLLRSTVVSRFTARIGPSDSLIARDTVMNSRAALGHEPDDQGLSGSSLFVRRAPFFSTPGSPLAAI